MNNPAILPADEGHQAYRDRKTLDDNPYLPDDWKHDEWKFGWDCEEQGDGESCDWVTKKIL